MDLHADNLKILITLTVGFSLASILGYLTQKMRLSPVFGYLLAGYIAGPYSPGYVFDMQLSEQLAEIGVVLMMFGVGMHFKWQDLLSVKNIAITGGVGQTFVATCAGAGLVYLAGMPLYAGFVVGLAISVASTVVLVRVLTDNHLVETPQGHVAIGWLVVEDILTVAALVLLPIYAQAVIGNGFSWMQILFTMVVILFKFFVLALVSFTIGKKLVTLILSYVARTQSHELLTLTVLALTFVIAAGSAELFGTSIALGAFIAGMVIGQSDVKHQASANSLPIRDTFVVLFFLSVGMIFNPSAIWSHPLLFASTLATILIIKPLTAFFIVTVMHYPLPVAVTVALGLAQIGEFSFILSEIALKLKILPDEGYDIIVACAIITIAINPILFRWIENLKIVKQGLNKVAQKYPHYYVHKKKQAVVVGYGLVGQLVTCELEHLGFDCLIIDRNVDLITTAQNEGKRAFFGDFTQLNIIKGAKLDSLDLLVVTVPEIQTAVTIIELTRQTHPKLSVIARANSSSDKQRLERLNVDSICIEEQLSKELLKQVTLIIRTKFLKRHAMPHIESI